MGRFVAGDADEPDVGVGQQMLRRAEESQAGTQNRDDDRLRRQPDGRRLGERRGDGALDGRQRLGRLGDQQRPDPFEVGPEERVGVLTSRIRANASRTSG